MLDRIAGIAIEKGPMPEMKKQKGRMSERMQSVRGAIEKMPSDSWFVVPDTSKADEKKNTALMGQIRKFVKDSSADGKEWAIGVAVGVRASDGALIVRKTADIAATKRLKASPVT